MTRYNYDQCYLYFNIGVLDTDLKELVKANSIHYCLLFVVEDMYLERYDKTRHTATILLDNGTKVILHEYSLDALDSRLQEIITPIWLMKEIYDQYINMIKPSVKY